MRLWFLGHAFWVIEGSKNIYIDPFVTGNSAFPGSFPVKPDLIIVTHGHGDHVGDSLDLSKRYNAPILTNFEIHNWLRKRGANAIGAYIGGKLKFDFGWVKFFPAAHGSSLPDGSYGGVALSVALEVDGKRIYHAGDTGLIKEMEFLRDLSIDVALLPIGGWFTMDIDDAVIATKMIEPKIVIPMHYNTFDRIAADPQEFKEKVESQTNSKCIILKPGEHYEL